MALVGFFIAACGGSPAVQKVGAPSSIEVRFGEAKAAYDKGDWLEAMRLFEEVRVEGPASAFAADATFLEAMSRFHQELYSGAAVDFRAMRRNYPSSPSAQRAQFMIGESYFQLSPRPELDQTYSTFSLQEFQIFLRDYPSAPSSMIDSAQHRIAQVRNKLAKKMLMTGELYVKLEESKAAITYFNRVLDNYYDTDAAPEAELRIAEVHYDHHRIDESRRALQKFESKFLGSVPVPMRERALALRNKLTNS